jgi:DNA repair protein RadC
LNDNGQKAGPLPMPDWQVRFFVSEPFTRFAPIIAPLSNKERECYKMEKVFEIQRIKQVIQEVEGGEQYIVRSPEDGAKIASQFIGDDDREVFFVMCLNTKNRVVAVHRCHVGSLNSSIVTPREVFKSAILNNCASIIVSHQRPSQNVSPSDEDFAVTRRLVESGRILGIEVLDHLIVNANAEYYSFKEKGKM